MTAYDAEFFWDPACPFAWATSKFVRAVVAGRGIHVDWRPISLAMLNEGGDTPEMFRATQQLGLQALRVAVAARDAHGPETSGALYERLGAIWHENPDGFRPGTDPIPWDAVLADCGLPAELAAAADDPAWDATIRSHMDNALSRAGADVGTPIISFAPPDGPAFFGPVISAAPDDTDAAGRYWDALVTLSQMPGFSELKRTIRDFPASTVQYG